MKTLKKMSEDIGRTWDTISDGWRELIHRCTDSLTRFTNDDAQGEVDIATKPAQWGLLAADIATTKDHVIVRLEAPGMRSDDFNIEVHDDRLEISGEKHAERTEKGRGFVRTERAFGRFHRSIPLPAEVDVDDVKANYKHGVLEVELAKHERAKTRKIKITAR